jgi:hypothetical protein
LGDGWDSDNRTRTGKGTKIDGERGWRSERLQETSDMRALTDYKAYKKMEKFDDSLVVANRLLFDEHGSEGPLLLLHQIRMATKAYRKVAARQYDDHFLGSAVSGEGPDFGLSFGYDMALDMGQPIENKERKTTSSFEDFVKKQKSAAEMLAESHVDESDEYDEDCNDDLDGCDGAEDCPCQGCQDDRDYEASICEKPIVVKDGECWKKAFISWYDKSVSIDSEGPMDLEEFASKISTAATSYLKVEHQGDKMHIVDRVDLLDPITFQMCEKPSGYIDSRDLGFAILDHNAGKPNDLHKLLGTIGKNVKVGSELHWNAAMDQHAPDLLKAKVQDYVDKWYQTRRKTRYALSAEQTAAAKFYIGEDFTTDCASTTTSDHVSLQVARDFCRQDELALSGFKEDQLNVLHIGATFSDFKAFRSRPGHDFLFCFKDAKDASRTIVSFTGYLMTELALRKITIPGINRHITWDNFQKVVDYYNKYIAGRLRVYLDINQIQMRYLRLMFSDSMYDMTEETVLKYFHLTGALEAYSVMFFPYAFYESEYQDSDFYVMEDYYDFGETQPFIDRFNEVWPELLLTTPALSAAYYLVVGEEFMQTVHRFVLWLAAQGRKHLMDFVSDVWKSHDHLATFTSMSLAIAKFIPIFDKVRQRIVDWIDAKYKRTNVTWKGYQNGYDHRTSTWKNWAVNRCFSNDSMAVVSEQVSRYGEMGLWKFTRTNDAKVTWRYSIPDHARQMKILDWEKSVDMVTGVPKEIKVWTTCRIDDFYKLLSWAQAEPKESLSLEVMMAAGNRVRKGLSLISYTPFRGLDVSDKKVFNFVVNVYFTWMRMSSFGNTLETYAKEYTGQVGNLEKLLETLVKATAVIVTGGMAVPIYKLIKWLLQTQPSYEFIQEPPDPAFHIQKAKVHVLEPEKIPITISVPIPPKEADDKVPCLLCKLQAEGKFGKQKFFIEEDCTKIGAYEWEMNTEDCAQAKAMITQAITDHRPHMGPNQIDVLMKFESVYDGEVSYKGKSFFHYVLGGAGTGKSTIIKELTRYLESQSKLVTIAVPLKKLKADFTATELLDGSTATFKSQTPWLMPKYNSTDVLILDESGLHDELWTRAYIAFANPREIYIVGDHHQHDRVTQFDGRNGLLSRDWFKNLKKTQHELVYNFRLDAWRVKWANDLNGTHMIAVRKDELPPKFISIQEYRDLEVETEYVFAHASAATVFGKNSSAARGPDDINMSVYSSQGATVQTAAVSCTDLDQANFENVKGAVYVAMSRSKGQTYFVCPDVLSPTAISLKMLTKVVDQDAIDYISNKEWEESVGFQSNLPEEGVALAREALPTYKEWDVRGFVATGSGNVKTLTIPEGPITQPVPRETHWDNVVHPCTFELIPEEHKDAYIIGVIMPIVEKAARDSKANFSDTMGWLACSEKQFVSMDLVVKFLKDHRVSHKAWYKAKGSFFKTNGLTWVSAHKEPGETVQLFIEIEDRHAVLAKEKDAPKILMLNVDGNLEQCDHGETFYGETVESIFMRKKRLRKCYMSISHEDLVPNAGKLPSSLVKVMYPDTDRMFRPAIVRSTGQTYVDNTPAIDKFFERGQVSKAKLRVGEYEAYRSHELIEQSKGYKIVTGFDSPTELHSLKPHKYRYPSAKVNAQAMMFTRTKTGKLTHDRFQTIYRLAPGNGNYFNNSPYMTFKAVGRLLKPVRNKPLTAEAKTYLDNAALKAARTNHSRLLLDDTVVNRFALSALRDGKSRNYVARAQAEQSKGVPLYTTFATNKDIYKPTKDGKIDHDKGGQALLTPTSSFNTTHIAPHRVLGAHYKATAKDHFFLDLYEPKVAFIKRLSDKLRTLPVSAKCGIMDSREFDAGQGPATVYLQQRFDLYMGWNPEYLMQYMKVREPTKVVCYGLLKGKTKGQKGSGFPDTLLGNSQITEIMETDVFRGQGPKVDAVKGDDAGKWQANLEVDPRAAKAWKTYTNLDTHWSISMKGGEFCGLMLTRNSAAPSLERMACKIIGKKFRVKSDLYEYQKSVRNDVLDLRCFGFEEVINVNAMNGRKSRKYYENCLAFIVSFSHISWEQFEKAAMKIQMQKCPRIAGHSGPDIFQLSVPK